MDVAHNMHIKDSYSESIWSFFLSMQTYFEYLYAFMFAVGSLVYCFQITEIKFCISIIIVEKMENFNLNSWGYCLV